MAKNSVTGRGFEPAACRVVVVVRGHVCKARGLKLLSMRDQRLETNSTVLWVITRRKVA